MPKTLTGLRIDWAKIRSEFIHGAQVEFGRPAPWTYQALAKHFGVSAHSIGKRATEEGWQSLREKHMRKTEDIISRRKAENIAKRAVKFDSDIFDLSDDALKILRGILRKQTVIEQDGVEIVSESLADDLGAMDIRRVLEAADFAQCIREKAVKENITGEDDSIAQLIKIIEAKKDQPVVLQLPNGQEAPVQQDKL